MQISVPVLKFKQSDTVFQKQQFLSVLP